jgi:hypothetical protein
MRECRTFPVDVVPVVVDATGGILLPLGPPPRIPYHPGLVDQNGMEHADAQAILELR